MFSFNFQILKMALMIYLECQKKIYFTDTHYNCPMYN
jgi:hypothetical protein